LLAVEMKYSRENVDAAKASLAPGATPTAVTDARLSTRERRESLLNDGLAACKTLASKQEGRLVFAGAERARGAYSCLDGRAATADVAPQDAGSHPFRGEAA
jgi:hypothetical protein